MLSPDPNNNVLRMCCSFVIYKVQSYQTGYLIIVSTQTVDEIRHMKLQHFSYITWSKLQHILLFRILKFIGKQYEFFSLFSRGRTPNIGQSIK